MAALCDAYWYPVYAFVRRRTHDADRAADLTQAFFAHVLEKHALDTVDPALGRFRSFLLASVKHFVANERERESTLKRGHGWTRVPGDIAELEQRFATASTQSPDPEQVFERQWAATLLDRALDRVKAQQQAAGRAREFVALAPFLTSDTGPERPYRDVAQTLGTTEPAVRTAVHRLRVALGKALRDEVAHTVSDAGAAESELRHLLSVLAG
jgi:RNA polymerase sigma-70 factor (ECF subfamily)